MLLNVRAVHPFLATIQCDTRRWGGLLYLSLSMYLIIQLLNINPHYLIYDVFLTPLPLFSNASILSSGVGFLEVKPVLTVPTSSLSFILVLKIAFPSGVAFLPLPIFQLLLFSTGFTTTLPSLSVVVLVCL